MNTVWTLMTGENHRGGRIIGIFSARSAAVKAAEAAMKEDTWGELPWEVTFNDDSEQGWHNDGDWYRVGSHQVDSKVVN